MLAQPLARYASLSSFRELSGSLGLDASSMLRAAGLDPASLDLQDRWVPAAAIADLLERAASASGRADFGLRLAELRRFSNLGPLSMVIREEPDVRSALRILMRYERTYNEALHIRLAEREDVATVHLELDLPVPRQQSTELAAGVFCGLMRAFLGPTWRPISVGFAHPAPSGPTIHHRMLGPGVRFDQDGDRVTVAVADLDARNALSDPVLHGYAQRFLEPIEQADVGAAQDRVRELVEVLLPTGRCSVEQVARSLGVDRRTVHRMLAREGHTFTSVLEATRRGLAERMVRNPNRSLTEVAETLAFSSHSNFTRWFRNQFGCSPSQWRSRAR